MTNQEKPHGIFLERRNDIIEIHQIRPRVKKKKKKGRRGRYDNRQHKDKGVTDGDEISIVRP